ncbi:hypothetical protein VNO77_21464 [Canavalia gladiata]|uniref:Uncharacterized protein n=1 Tax=Canavalia gladiata TaxID=3824 RepID=A0AAN9LW72_CANGL
MMKLGSILLIALALFGLLGDTYGGESSSQFCPKDLTLPGKCPIGSSGIPCLGEFTIRFGPKALPRDCTCTDLPGFNRKCTCQVLC